MSFSNTSNDTPGMVEMMQSRRSIRAYLDDAVDKQTIESLLVCARLAPSGANLQPGTFHVLTGEPLASLSSDLLTAHRSHRPVVSQYSYFPDKLTNELKARQKAAGFALYDALGIGKRDVAERRKQFERNYSFFNAPVGIVVTINRDMGKGCFMDLGMAIMNLLLGAQSCGLGATGIGALANHGDVVHESLGLNEDELVVCGIAVGKPDAAHPVNEVRTEREPLENYSSFRGF